MTNDEHELQKRYLSRKALGEVFDRSPRWVAEVTRRVTNYGGRYRLDEVEDVLRCGYRPCRRKHE